MQLIVSGFWFFSSAMQKFNYAYYGLLIKNNNTALIIVCALLRYVAGKDWGSKRYLCMKCMDCASEWWHFLPAAESSIGKFANNSWHYQWNRSSQIYLCFINYFNNSGIRQQVEKLIDYFMILLRETLIKSNSPRSNEHTHAAEFDTLRFNQRVLRISGWIAILTKLRLSSWLGTCLRSVYDLFWG